MSPDESCPHWTLHNGVCRDCGKRPKIERKPIMTPNPDPVAVLREIRAGNCTYSGAQENAALDAAIAALEAQGEAVAEVGNDGSVVWLTLNPPKRGASLYLHPAPLVPGMPVTEDEVCIALAAAHKESPEAGKSVFWSFQERAFMRRGLEAALAARSGKARLPGQ